MNILKLIEKNLKILFRSKFSSFVVVLGPIIIILLAGLAFNNSAEYNIKIGTYSANYSSTADVFIKNLENDFEVKKMGSEEECINSIKTKGYHSCILIPAGLDISNGYQENIDFYIDNSRVNIASYIEQNIYQTIQNSSEGLSKDLAVNLVDTIKITRDEMNKNKQKISSEDIHIEEIKLNLEKSKNTLSNTNLDFDKKDVNVDQLSNLANGAKREFDNSKSLVQESITDYDKTTEDLKDEGINTSGVNNIINDANSNVVALSTKLTSVKNNSSNLNDIITISDTLSEKIGDVENKLKNAKKNTEQTKSNLDSNIEELEKTKGTLKEMGLSFSKVESSINSNKVLDAESITRPVNIKEHQIVSGSKLNSLFPSLIILVIMFVTLMMSSEQVTQERLNKSNLRISMTPLNFANQLAATFLSIMIIVTFQIFLIILTVWSVFGINIQSSFLSATGVLISTAVFFTLLGIALGNIFRSEQATLLGSASIASMFFIISDLILPIESMPNYMIGIISNTPFVLATNLLRKTIFFNSGINTTEFHIFLGYILILIFALIIINGIIVFVKKLKTKKTYF